MLKFLKKFFSLKSSPKKQKVLIVFLLFLFFFLLYPISCAQASWGWLQWIPGRIANAIAGLILTAVLALAQGILNLGIIFFNLSLNGFPVSYTNPAGNEVIRVGWTLIRDIANIGLVLGLIYIGLATALRIAGFETKKAFVWFLIMALLVNFTPVICGIIVDASNIVMNFFLRGPGGWERLNSVFDEQKAIILQYALGEPNWVLYIKVMVLAAFGFVAGLIFILYGFLFFVRNPIIWVLVILSPLAFVAYIFPKTRGWFERWLNQLLQWSFIGAIAGFFLYLAQYTLLLATQGKLAIGGTPENTINELAPYTVAVVFLIIGFYTSTMTSAMGASTVIGLAKTKGKAALKWGGKTLSRGWKRSTRRLKKGVGEAAENAKGPVKGAEGESKIVKGLKFAPRAFSWAMRKTGASRALTSSAAEAYRKDIEKAKKEAKEASNEKLYAMAKSISSARRIAALETAIEKNKIGALRGLGLTDADIKKTMEKSLKISPDSFRKFRNAEPRLAQNIVGATKEEIEKNVGRLAKRIGVDISEEEAKEFNTLEEKLMATAKPNDIKQWSNDTIRRALQSESFHKHLTGAKLRTLIEAGGYDARKEWQRQAAKKEWYEKNNSPLYNYISSSPGAQELGLIFGNKETPGSIEIAETEPLPEKEKKRKKPPETFGRHVSKI